MHTAVLGVLLMVLLAAAAVATVLLLGGIVIAIRPAGRIAIAVPVMIARGTAAAVGDRRRARRIYGLRLAAYSALALAVAVFAREIVATIVS